MQPGDVAAAAICSAAAFDVDLSEESSSLRWHQRVAYPLTVDPAGAFVAERGGRLIGVAQALRRERLWQLSLLTVEPTVQGAGAGRALMARALAYDEGTDAGLIVSSNDPRAMRLYARAGFAVLPTLQTEGRLDRSALPAPDPAVIDGDREDLEELAAISREIRGAPHTKELEYALDRGGRLLRLRNRGFAVVLPDWCVWLLVARDEDSARSLLWSALAAVGDSDRSLVRWLTAGQQWAVQLLVDAGLQLSAYGALCVRGDPGPLAPFVPSGPFA